MYLIKYTFIYIYDNFPYVWNIFSVPIYLNYEYKKYSEFFLFP